MKSTVSSKGQITIPIEMREHLGLKTGTPVLFQKHPQGFRFLGRFKGR
jgi:AbrB family looped-hinge helix DNA binding protein